MTKTLYLFVTSNIPDPYVNSIVHCFKKKKIIKAVLLHIDEDSDTDKDASKALEISIHIHALLDALADGKYVYRPSIPNKSYIDLGDSDAQKTSTARQLYGECHRKVSIVPYKNNQDIPYSKVREVIAQLHHDEPESIFDVAAVGKEKLGDIFSVFLTEGIDNLHTFQITRQRDFEHPWKDLIHELEENHSYRYVNLLDTLIYKECLNLIKVYPKHTSTVSQDEYEQAVRENQIRLDSLSQNEQQKRVQSNIWFIASVGSTLVGLIFIGVLFISLRQNWDSVVTNFSGVISAISGFLLLVFISQSNRANRRTDVLVNELSKRRDIDLQIRIIESMKDPIEKDKLKSEVVRAIPPKNERQKTSYK